MNIPFPRSLDLASTETAIRRYFRSSVDGEIRLSLADTTWCEPFAALLLVQWLQLLCGRGAAATLLVRPGTVLDFLEAYGVIERLTAFGVTIDAPSGSGRAKPRPLILHRPAGYVPLTPFEAATFGDALASLDPGRILQGDDVASELARTGVIRDVFLAELGENVLHHSGVGVGWFLMAKLGSPRHGPRRRAAGDPFAPLREFEQVFFDQLAGQAYVEFALGDSGVGIPTTMAESVDPSTRQRRTEEATDGALLEQAFDYYATRRSRDERVASLEQFLLAREPLPPPVTGLYRLRETVRLFEGLLYVRSRSALVAYDFRSDGARGLVFRGASELVDGSIGDFPGAQFRLLIPLSRRQVQRHSPLVPVAGFEVDPEHVDVAYSIMPHQAADPGACDEAATLFAAQKSLEVSRQARKGEWIHVVDVEPLRALSAKAAHYLLLDALLGQPAGEALTFANVPRAWIAIGQERPDGHVIGERSAVVFDAELEPWLVRGGLGGIEIVPVADADASPRKDDGRLLRVLRSLLGAAGTSAVEICDRARAVLRDLLIVGVRENLGSALGDTASGVHRPTAKVALPSGRYCHGYFEVGRALHSAEFRDGLVRWVTLSAAQLGSTHILTLGPAVQVALAGAVTLPQVALFSQGGTPLPVAELLSVPSEARVLFVADVVGTGRTLQTALALLTHVRDVQVIALVDARERGAQAIPQMRAPALSHPLTYYDTPPRGWLLGELCRVDRRTNGLVEPRPDEKLLWDESNPLSAAPAAVTNRFLVEALAPAKAVVRGHFSADARHFAYLFDIPRLASARAKDLAAAVVADVRSGMEAAGEFDVCAIVAAAYNPGVPEIARAIGQHFPDATLVQVQRGETEPPALRAVAVRGRSRGHSSTRVALIIDDAFESGKTFLTLLQAARHSLPDAIKAYVVVRRGTLRQAAAIQGISGYRAVEGGGSAEVSLGFIGEVETPTFESAACPLCEHARQWHRAGQVLQAAPYARRACEDERRRLLVQEVGPALDVGVQLELAFQETTPITEVELRWRVQAARQSVDHGTRLKAILADGDRRSARELLVVLHRERLLQASGDNEVSGVMDAGTRELLRVRARECLQSHCSAATFHAALYVLASLDPSEMRRVLAGVFRLTLRSPELLVRLAAFSVAEPLFDVPPEQMLSVIGEARAQLGGSAPDVQDTLRELRRHWLSAHQESAASRVVTLERYRDLAGGVFHEVTHLFNHLDYALSSGPLDAMQIGGAWDGLAEEFSERILPRFEAFMRGIGGVAAVRAMDLVDDVLRDLENGSRITRALRAAGATERVGELIVLLESVRRRVETTVAGPGGLRATLGRYSVDVKKVVVEACRIMAEGFSEKRIVVERQFPDEGCVAFGDEKDLILVFVNLLKNVWRHSGASSLRILMTRDVVRGTVKIELIDNGVGFASGSRGRGRGRSRRRERDGAGLSRCREVTRRYCGALTVDRGSRKGARVIVDLALESTAEV